MSGSGNVYSEVEATNQRESGMPAKLERCVEHVQAKTKDKSRAYAICVSSTGLKPRSRRKASKKTSRSRK